MGVKELRMKAGISQGALAKAVGVSQGAVSHWEHGANRPTFEMIPRLASALGVTADEVVSAIQEVPVKC